MLGIGGRAVYGFTKNLSVEGSLGLLSTQEAQFDDSSTAEATTVRALFGGVLHFGDKTVPYFRAGIGARLSSYTMSSPDDSQFRGSGLFRVGGGVDFWLGKTVVLGISAHYVGTVGGGDESYSFEAGTHAGFAWKP